jgi:uncharacterized protein
MKPFSQSTNVILTIALVVVLLALVIPGFEARAALATPTAVPAVTQPICDPARSVQSTGTAVINVVPDRALIQLGVQSSGYTPDAVEAANSAAIQKVIKALQALGIQSKDIATDWYYVEPVYENYDSMYIKGYRINNVVAVTLRDLKKPGAGVNNVISTALKAGANQIVNVELYISELRKYRDQARELATKAAREKASALAQAAGTETGCVLTITENIWSYYNGWWSRSNSNLWMQNVVQNVPAAGGGALGEDGPVSLGMISIKAEVGVTFGLK